MNTLPTQRKWCPACGAALTLHECYAGGFCSDWKCRHRRIEAQHKAEFNAGLVRDRDAAAAALGDPQAAAAPVVVIRRYATDPVLEPVPDAQRQAVHEHMQGLRSGFDALSAGLADALVDDAEPSTAVPPETPADIDALLGDVCATCRGYCCRQGRAQHAFIDADQMHAAALRRPGASFDDVVAYYMNAMPAMHMSDSCIFHGDSGCVLPREDRAEICNSWECRGREQARQHAEIRGVRRIYLVRHQADVGSTGGFLPPA